MESNYWKYYETNQRYKEKNKEKVKQWAKDWHHKTKLLPEHHRKRLLKYAKARATKHSIEFSLTLEDINIPERCPILNVVFDNDRYSASLDRKDPTKGYTSDNVWVISHRANAMKWDSTKEERLAFANWVLSEEGGK
jgi:hypothetical protein